MRLRECFVLCLLLFVFNNVNADIMYELRQRGRQNPIMFDWPSALIIHANTENGYLMARIGDDTADEASIVAYQIHENNIKLIIRVKTWDVAYRIFDRYYSRGRSGEIDINVHDYYLVELVYVNNKLETYCNRITDINTNGFVFNDAEISKNANVYNLPYEDYLTYSDGFTLTEGMKAEIVSFTNELTNQKGINTATFNVHDYMYHVLIENRRLLVNGYFLDFCNIILLN